MGKKFLVIDNRELKKFTETFDTHSSNSSTAIKNALEYAANQYLKDVTERTPVNKDLTAPTRGNLKKQWSIDNTNLAAKITETNDGFMIEIINTTYYASWVEKGHNIKNEKDGPVLGWCMGQFFVKKTEVLYNQGKLDTFIARIFDKWLESMTKGG